MKETGAEALGRMKRSIETLLLGAVLMVYSCVLPLYAANERAGESETVAVSANGYAAGDMAYETMRRDELRQSAIESLAALAADPDISEAQRLSAQEQMEKRLAWAEQEAAVEEELDARGFPDCVVNIATGFASVIVPASPGRAQVASICEAVERISGLSGGDIRVIPVS